MLLECHAIEISPMWSHSNNIFKKPRIMVLFQIFGLFPAIILLKHVSLWVSEICGSLSKLIALQYLFWYINDVKTTIYIHKLVWQHIHFSSHHNWFLHPVNNSSRPQAGNSGFTWHKTAALFISYCIFVSENNIPEIKLPCAQCKILHLVFNSFYLKPF